MKLSIEHLDTDNQFDLEEDEQLVDIENVNPEEVLRNEPEPEVNPTPADDEDIPAKFKGKSPKEIAKAYSELEKSFGKQANDLGELRKLTDQILLNQIQTRQQGQTPEQEPELDENQFFENPKEAVAKAIERHPKFQQLEQAATRVKQLESTQALLAAHTDFQEIAQSPEFIDFIKASPVRMRLFTEADRNYDWETAADLMSTYKEIKLAKVESQVKTEQKQQRDKALKAAGTQTGSTGESPRKVYTRQGIINLMIHNPAKYAAMQDEIYAAYVEGRVK